MTNDQAIEVKKPAKIAWWTLGIGIVLGFALAWIMFLIYRLGQKDGVEIYKRNEKPSDTPKPELNGQIIDVTNTSVVKAEPAPMEKSVITASETPTVSEPVKPQIPQYNHSEDFRFINWGDKKYELTTNQSRVVERLWKAFESRIPVMHQSALLEGLEICSQRLRDVFKNKKEAFKTLIVSGECKGTFRMNLNWE